MPSIQMNPDRDPAAVARELRRLSEFLEKGDRRLAELALARCEFLRELAAGNEILLARIDALQTQAQAVLEG